MSSEVDAGTLPPEERRPGADSVPDSQRDAGHRAGRDAEGSRDANRPRPGAASPQIPGYELLSMVGTGGYATVWQARQLSVDRTVALKVLHQVVADEATRVALDREISVLVELSWNPSIVHIYDAGVTDDGRPYLALEYMPGGTVATKVRNDGPLPAESVRRIGVALADAMDAAHGAGVLHRDIKPDNILLDQRGHPRLADFGIARIADASVGATTSGPSFRGTILYSAPEVLDGDPPTPASDIWGIGATLYMLCAGHSPFSTTDSGTADSLAAVIRRTLLDDPAPLPETVPRDLATATMACLAKDPALRPPSAADLRELLIGASTMSGTDANVARVAGAGAAATDPDEASDPVEQADQGGDADSPDATTAGTAAGRTPTKGAPARRAPRAIGVAAAVVAIAVIATALAFLYAGDRSEPNAAESATRVTEAPVAAERQTAAPPDGSNPDQIFDPGGPRNVVVLTDSDLTSTSDEIELRVAEFEASTSLPAVVEAPGRIPRGPHQLGFGHTPVRFDHRAYNVIAAWDCIEVRNTGLIMRGAGGGVWTNGSLALTVTVMHLGSVEDARAFYVASSMFFGVTRSQCDGWPEDGVAIDEPGLSVERQDYPLSSTADEVLTTVVHDIEAGAGITAETQYAALALADDKVVAAQAAALVPGIPRDALRSAIDETMAFFLAG